MPQVVRTRKIQESLQTVTRDGEITINLNLNITVDDSNVIRIESAGATVSTTTPLPEDKTKKLEIVPTELFSKGDDLLENFGAVEKTK